MKKIAASLPILETVFWILASLYARHLVDVAAQQWKINELGIFLIKIGAVLALIALALWLHRLFVRFLVNRGLLPKERQD